MIEIGIIVLCFAFSDILVLETVWVVLGSVVTLNFPFFESVIVASISSLVTSRLLGKRKGISLLAGWFLGNIFLAFLKPIMLFYPFVNRFGFSQVSEAGLTIFASILGISLLMNAKKISNSLSGIKSSRIQSAFFVSLMLFSASLSFFEKTSTPICSIKNSPEKYDEKYVLTQGNICSSIQEKYGYYVFYLCDECNISVWSKREFLNTGKIQEIFGVFSLKYQEPEIIVK